MWTASDKIKISKVETRTPKENLTNFSGTKFKVDLWNEHFHLQARVKRQKSTPKFSDIVQSAVIIQRAYRSFKKRKHGNQQRKSGNKTKQKEQDFKKKQTRSSRVSGALVMLCSAVFCCFFNHIDQNQSYCWVK